MTSVRRNIPSGKDRTCLALIFILLILAFSTSCEKKSALERIKSSGKITLVTRNNAHCYYNYRDSPAGFEHDLAKAFSDFLGVKLRVATPSWNMLVNTLDEGQGDFIAASLTITPSRTQLLDFAVPYLSIQQHIIIHKFNDRIRKLEDLEGKDIHVRRGTSYEERLKEIAAGGLKFNLILHEDTPTEELMEMVAQKEIEITVADSNIALLNRQYVPDVKLAFPISEPQSLAWAVKKGHKSLLARINAFFKKIQRDGTFAKIYRKYYGNVEIFDYVDLKKFHLRLKTRLPKYRKIIQKASKKSGFDWRLIAAMMYQESHFDPAAESFAGAAGIMQLTSLTAKEMEIEDRLDPKQSILGGIQYLKKLYDMYTEAENPDRMLIALASYNVGRGHILDARKLAKDKGLNPDSWAALEQTLPLLRYPKYYKKASYGYCRGTEPVRYINRILTYYDILRRESIS